jgi:hypothetical protein
MESEYLPPQESDENKEPFRLPEQYSFAGKDPGKILLEDPNAVAYDYEGILRDAGYGPENPPTFKQLLHALSEGLAKMRNDLPSQDNPDEPPIQ